MWLGRALNEFKSKLNAHFAMSPLLYDHRAILESRERLGAGSLHVGTAGSCSAEHRGPLRCFLFLAYDDTIISVCTYF